MRFTATGPNIPNELIEAQKRGELLFFCGAGVSVPAGLPSFEKLTKNVADKLHALDDEESEISNLLFNKQFDRTFTALKRTYGDEIVDSILLDELKTPKSPILNNHKNLLKLSVNEEKRPFIITTNFDLLFEKVDSKIQSYIPPYLPDLQSKEALSGIVYLHGKWVDPKKNKLNNLIISSQNFGSAYLSHGWATRFLSNLLTRRTVVLIGYSGDDTLVRYLLEGLNSERSNTNNIYAFERGEQGDIESKWSQLGATGISYPGHKDLWETVAEWAKYAGDDQKWNDYIKYLSQQSPKALEPFERGIVANYVSKLDGAFQFSQFEPAPCAEWIYVLDKKIRLGGVEKIKTSNGEKLLIDPIDLYGTDIDLSRSELDSLNEHVRHKVGHDYISVTLEDNENKLTEGLSNLPYENLWRVQSRITILAKWFSRVSEQPSAIWWAQKQENLHPVIIDLVQKRIKENPNCFFENDLKFWLENISNHIEKRKYTQGVNWYELKVNLEKAPNITTEIYLRYLTDILTPILKIQQVYISEKVYIPTRTDENYLFSKFEVDFPQYIPDVINIQNDNVKKVVEIITNSLVKYIDYVHTLKDEAKSKLFHDLYYPSINFENPLANKRSVHEKIGYLILWMCVLLKKMIILDEDYLIDIFEKWPKNDDLIFNRLKLFVLANSIDIKKLDIGFYFLSLSEHFFWNRFIEADLMYFLSNKWDSLTEEVRSIIENKIIIYRENFEYEDFDKYINYKNYRVGRLLNKISQTEFGLSKEIALAFERIKETDNWQDEYIIQESLVAGVQSGFISTNTSFEELNKILDSAKFFETVELLESDRSIQFERKKPFVGFVADNLSEALNKLLEELEKDNKREKHWIQFFDSIPSEVNQKQLCLIGEAILKLPQDIINSCRFPLTRFIEERLINACLTKKDLFWGVWDYVFNTLNLLGSEATSSAFGDTFESGRKIKKSRKTLEHAMNSPIGQLVDALFKIYSGWEVRPKQLHDEVIGRLEVALKSDGEGSYHAVSMIMYRIDFMFKNYEAWSKYHLVPIFETNHQNSEAAWESFFHMKYKPSNEIILILKPYFFELFNVSVEWSKSEKYKNNLSKYLVYFCYWSYPKQTLFSNIEIRKLLRSFDSNMLSNTLWWVSNIIKSENVWRTFGRFFFKNIWPKENFCQSSKSSERLLSLAIDTPDYFVDIIKHIEPYLKKIESSSLFLYRLINDNDGSLITINNPDEVLLVLDRVVGQKIESYDDSLGEILEQIVKVKPVLKNSLAWQRLHKVSISVF